MESSNGLKSHSSCSVTSIGSICGITSLSTTWLRAQCGDVSQPRDNTNTCTAFSSSLAGPERSHEPAITESYRRATANRRDADHARGRARVRTQWDPGFPLQPARQKAAHSERFLRRDDGRGADHSVVDAVAERYDRCAHRCQEQHVGA